MAKKKNNSNKRKNKSKNQGKKSQQLGTKVDRQTGSLFFRRLPQEIRVEIYSHVFSSTRLAFGERTTGRISTIDIKPARNSLALLRVCRRMKHEIGNSWLSQVLFFFEDPGTLLDKLTPLPRNILSRLRRVTFAGDTLMVSFPEDDVYYRPVSVLKLLPGLRLDVLTVLGGHGSDVNYDALSGLIADGSGWKELRYISCSSAMLGFSLFDIMGDRSRYHRKPQPLYWQCMMEDRDGLALKPSVTIYRATESGRYGSILDPSKRVQYEQKPDQVQAPVFQPGVFREDPELMTDGEKEKEILVVVKRGFGVDFEKKGGPPHFDGDIMEDMPVKTWAYVRANHVDFPDSDDDDYGDDYDDSNSDDDDDDEYLRGSRGCPSSSAKKEFVGQADVYKDVDEYAWNPLHFNPRGF
ncbi:hypothetical protein B0T19DRAFT_479447 [Cercophora scortea]|uniref:F-box domain-containing protein n=1 Tax=Cercophora scortea TaxID=314031 RepID=A0AAE0I2G0_9PEZI|nr:hypothetical protein B0T19DRAFT_479447 [Cercophora scortea]